jgi:hypothetical protein
VLPAQSTPESEELYNEFNSATEEILTQLRVAKEPQATHIEENAFDGSKMVATSATEQLSEVSPKFEMLSELSEDDHTTMLDQTSTKTSVTVTATSSKSGAQTADVKASYQSNVKTIYTHLEEIIKKILAHKEAWTQKYPPSPRQQATLSRTADSSASKLRSERAL